ncbi:MAG: response regulator [Deltaproteobacteria bacterium]|nr:response regulator [Deltaproteobacteria bacterium]
MPDSVPPADLHEEGVALIVDDEESIRDACQLILHREGYRVVTAPDGEAGLEAARRENPDLVFLDLKMPKLAGMAVLDELQAVAPDAVKVVVTAYATVTSALEAMRHGAFDFLAKPFTPDELRLVTRRAADRRLLTLQNRRLAQEMAESEARFAQLLEKEFRQPLARLEECLTGLADQVAPAGRDRINEAQGAVTRLQKLLADWR